MTNPSEALTGRRFFANFRVLLAGTAGAQVVGLLSIPLLTQLFEPAAYGRFASLYVVALTVGSLASLRFERAIVISDSDREARIVSVLAYRTLFLITTLAIAIAASIGVLSRQPASAWVLDAAIVGGLILFVGVYQIRSEWVIRNDTYRRLAIAEFVGVLAPTVAQVGAAMLGWRTATALLVGALAGRVVQLTPIVPTSYRKSARTRSDLFVVAKRYRSFAFFSTPYSLISVAPSRFVIVIATAFVPSAIVGFIAIGYRLTFLPVTTFANVLRRVYVQRLASDFGTDRLERETLLLARFVTLLLLPVFIGLGVIAPWVADHLLGAGWAGTGKYIQLFLPGAAAVLLTAWMDRVYEVTRRQGTAFVLEAISTAMVLGAYWLVLSRGGSAELAVGAFGAGIAIYNLVWLAFTWHLARFGIAKFMRQTLGLLLQLGALALLYLTVLNRFGWWPAASITTAAALVVVARETSQLLRGLRAAEGSGGSS